MRHMYADLMRASGFQCAFDKTAEGGEGAHDPPMGDGMPSARVNRLFFAVMRRTAKRGIDHAVTFNTGAPDQRVITAVKIMRREHAG